MPRPRQHPRVAPSAGDPLLPRPPDEGLLPAFDLAETLRVVATGDGRRAARRLGAAPLTAMPWPWRALLPLHDWVTGPQPTAWAQPRARLGDARGLAARAVAGRGCAGEGRRRAGEAEYWLAFAGKFWRPWHPLAAPSLAAFQAWQVPRTTRVAWRLSVRGEADGVVVEMVLRAKSVDRHAQRAFAAYMAFAGPASQVLRKKMLVGLAGFCGLCRARCETVDRA